MSESDQTARGDAVAGQKKPGQGRRSGIGRWNMSTTTIRTAIARGGQTALALAPDGQGRALAAVFTAADNFDAFTEVRQPALEEGQLLSLELTGVELFRLLAGMRLDGLVFNCSGPAAAVAFAHAFAEVILEA